MKKDAPRKQVRREVAREEGKKEDGGFWELKMRSWERRRGKEEVEDQERKRDSDRQNAEKIIGIIPYVMSPKQLCCVCIVAFDAHY